MHQHLTLKSLASLLVPFLLHHWWLVALTLGLLLLFGGKEAKKKKKKKKSSDSGGIIMLVMVIGAMLVFAGSTGTVVKTVIPAITHTSNRALGQQLAAHYGWGSGAQWNCLDALWTHESGWKIVWNYQGSGAFGIPQSLPARKMASAGADYMTNPATQIRWGLGYIRNTYGTPCDAWTAWQSRSPHWY